VVCHANNELHVRCDVLVSASPAAALPMTPGERETLEALARSQAAPHRQVLRAKALLMAADGEANTRIAEEVGVTPVTVRGWRKRFSEDGLAKLGQVRKGRGRKPTITDEQVAQIVRLSTEQTPPGHTHWSCRTMAKHAGVSHSAVQRIWSDLGIKPHRVDTFKVSTDAKFEDKWSSPGFPETSLSGFGTLGVEGSRVWLRLAGLPGGLVLVG
jgi:transposase